MTALVDIALTVSINLENTQRQVLWRFEQQIFLFIFKLSFVTNFFLLKLQYDAEQQKSRDKRATDRLEALMTRRDLKADFHQPRNLMALN